MASNIIKDLEIDIGDVYELIKEALIETISNIELFNVGDEADTVLDTEEVTVVFKDGKFFATIALQRTEGRFISNADLEEAFISEMANEKMTIEVNIQA